MDLAKPPGAALESLQQPPVLLPDGVELSAPNPNSRDAGVEKGTSEKKKEKKGKKGKFKVKVTLPLVGEITLMQLVKDCKEWLSNPVNAAGAFWCILAAGAFMVVVVVKLGFLNKVIPDETVREQWEEVATQILNALFVLMCLVWHPIFMRDVLLLIRWTPKDKKEIRAEYCKEGKRKPHDRTHMSIVVFWLQITCWATYAFAAVYWLYPLKQRPFWLFLSTFVISFAAPAFAFLHLILSPLSKDYDIVRESGGGGKQVKMLERSLSFVAQRSEQVNMEWNGSVFPGCCVHRRIAFLTCLFPFCMFGYNMQRLGFGHRVTHAAMFVIVLVGPLVVFEFSASSIESPETRIMVKWLGMLIAVAGVAYGGLWRIQMRETFNLPASRMCCWSARLTDICLWVCCSCCALCQEIRTSEQYNVVEGSYAVAVDLEGGDRGSCIPAIIEDAEEDDDVTDVGHDDEQGDDEDDRDNEDATPHQKKGQESPTTPPRIEAI